MRNWCFFGDVELVLAGVTIVVVLDEGHEDGWDESKTIGVDLGV